MLKSHIITAWANQDLCTDDGIPYNEFATPGDRIIDRHPDRIVYNIALSEAVVWTGDLLPQLAEVHIYSDSLKAIHWLFDASNHSSMECSLAALWAIQPWLDDAPDTKVVLHHVHKDVGLNAHSLAHLYATSTRIKAGGAPWRTFDSTRVASTAAMLVDWNILLRSIKYTGHNFLHLCFGGSPVTPSHIGGGP